MTHPVVELRALDGDSLHELLAAAVADADPLEVMPPVDGPPGWTEPRKRAFLEFHRSRSIGTATPVETTYVIVADGTVVGAARLEPTGDDVEAGVWIGRSRRGTGIGRAVSALLVAEAKKSGAARFVASTTVGNIAARTLLAGAGARLEVVEEGVEGALDLR